MKKTLVLCVVITLLAAVAANSAHTMGGASDGGDASSVTNTTTSQPVHVMGGCDDEDTGSLSAPREQEPHRMGGGEPAPQDVQAAKDVEEDKQEEGYGAEAPVKPPPAGQHRMTGQPLETPPPVSPPPGLSPEQVRRNAERLARIEQQRKAKLQREAQANQRRIEKLDREVADLRRKASASADNQEYLKWTSLIQLNRVEEDKLVKKNFTLKTEITNLDTIVQRLNSYDVTTKPGLAASYKLQAEIIDGAIGRAQAAGKKTDQIDPVDREIIRQTASYADSLDWAQDEEERLEALETTTTPIGGEKKQDWVKIGLGIVLLAICLAMFLIGVFFGETTWFKSLPQKAYGIIMAVSLILGVGLVVWGWFYS